MTLKRQATARLRSGVDLFPTGRRWCATGSRVCLRRRPTSHRRWPCEAACNACTLVLGGRPLHTQESGRAAPRHDFCFCLCFLRWRPGTPAAAAPARSFLSFASRLRTICHLLLGMGDWRGVTRSTLTTGGRHDMIPSASGRRHKPRPQTRLLLRVDGRARSMHRAPDVRPRCKCSAGTTDFCARVWR